jgi:hypothetical protein
MALVATAWVASGNPAHLLAKQTDGAESSIPAHSQTLALAVDFAATPHTKQQLC